MTLSLEQVKKIANLASIEFSPTELMQLQPELDKILDMINTMEQTDTDGILPMAHPLDQKQRLRPDLVTETDQHQEFQALAPEVAQGLYLVPKVIE